MDVEISVEMICALLNAMAAEMKLAKMLHSPEEVRDRADAILCDALRLLGQDSLVDAYKDAVGG